MKKAMVIVCFILFFVSVLCFMFFVSSDSVMGQTVAWTPNWNQGDKYKIEMTKRKTLEQPGVYEVPETKSTIIAEIVEKNSKGMTLRLTYEKIEIVGDKHEQKFEKMQTFLEGKHVDLFLNTKSVPQRVLNMDDVMKAFEPSIEDMAETLSKDIPAEIQERVKKQFKASMAPEAVQSLVFKELMLFWGLGPIKMEVGKPDVEEAGTMPNPYGGDPLVFYATTTLTSFDENTGKAVVEMHVKPDVNQINKIMEKIPFGQENAFNITDSTRYEIDTKTGWPISLEHKRVFNLSDGQRIDSFEIKTIENLTDGKN